jgi:hypothetical protein
VSTAVARALDELKIDCVVTVWLRGGASFHEWKINENIDDYTVSLYREEIGKRDGFDHPLVHMAVIDKSEVIAFSTSKENPDHERL